MAINDRIIRITTCTIAGTARDGVLEVGYSIAAVPRPGQSGNEAGPTSMAKPRYRVTGYILTDNAALGLALATGTVGILIVTGVRVGGGTITCTLGRTANSITSGIIVTGTGEHVYDLGADGGPAQAIRIPFEGVFHPEDTQLVNASSNGYIKHEVA